MPGGFLRRAGFVLCWLVFCGQAMAQNSATNQDDPVVIHKCVWLTTPVKDTSWLILGSAWAGRQDIEATRKKAAACVHAAPETISSPAPCPGGAIGVMSDQHFTPCL